MCVGGWEGGGEVDSLVTALTDAAVLADLQLGQLVRQGGTRGVGVA
jgi:hypothetical protein